MLSFTNKWLSPLTNAGPPSPASPEERGPKLVDRDTAVWRELFLGRLRHLAVRRRMAESRPWPLPHAIRLLDLALFSTYQDCVELGARQQAEQVLAETRTGSGPAASTETGSGDVGTPTGIGDPDGIGGTSGAVAHRST